MRLEKLHNIPVIKDIMPKLPMDEDYVIINESITFEPTDDYFSIGGKEFHEEGSDVYNIYDNDVKIGMLALEEFPDGINLEGLEIFKQYRKQGYGKKVVDLLKKKYEGIYVRSIPSAKKFWQKQGHKAYYNKDSGTYDGDLIYEELVYAERSDDYYDDSEYQDMTNVILKNPSRKELIDNGMIECRIVKDYKDNFYFANSYEMIHTDIVDKLESENITSVETNLFYDVNTNTFYYNVGHLADNEIKDYSKREEQMLRTSSYVLKTFGNFKFKLSYGEL